MFGFPTTRVGNGLQVKNGIIVKTGRYNILNLREEGVNVELGDVKIEDGFLIINNIPIVPPIPLAILPPGTIYALPSGVVMVKLPSS